MSAADRSPARAAGCLLGSFAGTRRRRGCSTRSRDGLGGVLLFGQNVVDDAQVAALCAELRDGRADVVIAIDEEGGDVTRLDAARPAATRRAPPRSGSSTTSA